MRLIADTTNLFGHLHGDVRDRLRAVLLTPTQETWDDAYTIILNGRTLTTLWQAVLAVDPTFPRSKPSDAPWERVPDQFTIAQAIRHATQEDQ